MNMQQMLIQAQKMKRELEKALNELKAQEFSITKNGAVTIKMLGDKTITAIEIDEDAFDKENKDMVEEAIVLGVNELSKKIADMEDEINESYSSMGMALLVGFLLIYLVMVAIFQSFLMPFIILPIICPMSMCQC